MIPDISPDEAEYTKALSLARTVNLARARARLSHRRRPSPPAQGQIGRPKSLASAEVDFEFINKRELALNGGLGRIDILPVDRFAHCGEGRVKSCR